MNNLQTELTIRDFEPGDQADFRRLNEEWILRHFVMEAKDEEALDDPEGTILAPGGRIFLAIQEGRAVGCCALLATARAGEFEVAKMAVTESARRNGIGRRLLEKAIAEARAAGAAHLYLETNRALLPAIRLYESIGFRHLPPERVTPSRFARANVHMEMMLEARE